MSDAAIRLRNLGKMYRLYARPGDKVLDTLGLGRWLFWRQKRHQDFWALREMNLEFGRGQRVGIIGRNGAGKSTLLKIICGNAAATEGTVEVHGKIQALMELGTGFHPEFTGRQNVRASLAYQGLPSARVAEKLEEIIDFSELEGFMDQPVRTYSAGMYARLAFATSTSVEPDVLIIDEILSAGDAYFAGKCLERMRDLTERAGATVLFVSHDLGSVQQLCPRTVWIDRGQVRRDGPSMDVVKEYAAVVRQEEDLRLRARDMRVHKRQAAVLKGDEDVFDRLLFHLVMPEATGCGEGVPPSRPAGILPADLGSANSAERQASPSQQGQTRIYSIRLVQGDQEIASIAVGAPQDNSPAYPNYLLTDAAYMDWGPPGKNSTGAYREFGDFGGRYRHAPFELAVPRSCRMDGCAPLVLEIHSGGELPAVVELFDGSAYHRVGSLPVGPCTDSTFALPTTGAKAEDAGETPTPPSAPPVNVHEYGTLDVRLTAVRLYNAAGVESRVLETGSPARVELDYEAPGEVPDPFFVFCVYLPDGRCASQWGRCSGEMGRAAVQGRGRVVFHLASLHLGRSAYVASAGIFKRRRHDGVEAESYHVLDRCIHFQVLQGAADTVPQGLCLQPVEAEIL